MRLLQVVLLVWVLLATLFAFTDLQISILFADPGSSWAFFLAEHGQKPGKLVCIIGLFLLAVARRERSWRNDLVAYALILLSAIAITAVLTFRDSYFWISVCLIMITQIVISRRHPLTSERWLLFAKVAVALFVLSLIFVNLGKDVWGRVRFVQLDEMYSQFTPWYLPQGYNDYKSFPSGHAAFAWMLLPLLVLIQERPRITRIVATSLVVIWALAVVVSRVRLGAHYASDVLFSSGIIIVSFLWFRSFFETELIKNRPLQPSIKPGEH